MNHHYQYWDVNNLYGWAMSQKWLVNGFKWVEETSECNEDFIRSYNDEIDEGYFHDAGVHHPEDVHNFHNDLPFLPEGIKIEKVE